MEYRSLLEGLAHLLRLVWVRRSEQVARELESKANAWVALRLADRLEALRDHPKTLRKPNAPITLSANTL